MFLTIGLFALIFALGNVDYAVVFSLAPLLNENIITIIGICFLIGAMAKSAQIGLHVWLPMAMEGKTDRTEIYKIVESNICLCKESNTEVKETISNKRVWPKRIRPRKGTKEEQNLRDLQVNLTLAQAKLLFSNALNVLTGELLGDGHISLNKNGTKGRAQFTFATISYEYIMYLKFGIFKAWSSTILPTPYPNPAKFPDKRIEQYWFGTKNWAFLAEVHSLWYIEVDGKKVKILPQNIGELLNAQGLAHWFMGDSYFDNSKNTVHVCTDNFTKEEVQLLINVLQENFDIKATLSKRKANGKICWRIRIPRNEVFKLRKLVECYYVPCMLYKLGIGKKGDHLKNEKK
jgi:hypothetical protein